MYCFYFYFILKRKSFSAIILIMKKIISIVLAGTILLCCTACSNVEKKERFTASFLDLFDTASTIIAYDTDQDSFDAHYELFYNELKKYDRLFDIYHSYDGITNLYTVNKKAAESPIKVDSEIIELLEYGKEIYKLSSGKTNICFGSVLELWHNERERASENSALAALPDMQSLQSAAMHTDIDNLIIDKANSTVYFKDSEMRLDVGAIAKGFAVQRVTEYARASLWASAAISIGGNVSTYGFKDDDGKTKWTIGIENPDTTAQDYLLKVDITDLSVVTSGDYQRFYTVNGKKYCHIINPETLMPSEYVSGVSVLCTDSALGDALSTTLFNMSVDEGKELIESIEGVEAVWVDKKFNKSFSSGFEEYVKD